MNPLPKLNSIEILLDTIGVAKNAALLVGAGISVGAGIPTGYKLPIEFGFEHPDILKEHHLIDLWQTAEASSDWSQQKPFVNALVAVFCRVPKIQEAMLSWLTNRLPMQGIQSDDHAIFGIAWLGRVFHHLITTNWDFLLEYQIDLLYEQSYTNEPLDPVTMLLSTGIECSIDSHSLFYLENLNDAEFAWNPRWNIATNPLDLDGIPRYSRTLWKIHGSPFFLACPRCSGINRWKLETPLHIGDFCPEHPEERLAPEIVFWGQNIDQPNHRIWKAVKSRLKRSDLIVVCGLSGSGSDAYIREVVQQHPNAWLVNPAIGEWDGTKVHFVQATASELTTGILNRFLL